MGRLPRRTLRHLPEGRLNEAARRCLWMIIAGLVALTLFLLVPRFAFAQTPSLFDPQPSTTTTFGRRIERDTSQFVVPAASGAATTGYDSLNRKRATGASAGRTPSTSSTSTSSTSTSATLSASASAASAPAAPSALPLPVPSPPRINRERVSASVAGIAPGQPERRRLRVEEDPFGQVGFYAGSMLVKTAVELIGGYDSNPARVTDGRGGAFYTIAPELLATSDWSRHALIVDLRGSYTGYGGRDFAEGFIGAAPNPMILDRPTFTGRITGRYDVTRDLRIEPELRAEVGTDNPGSPDIQSGLRRYPLTYSAGTTLGVAQRFNRLDLSVKGLADRTTYSDSRLVNGATAPNNDRNFDQYGAVARASYELTPGVKPFVEAGIDRRVHDSPLDRSGFARDSDGMTLRGGTTFELTRQLTGEISAGVLEREYEDARLKKLRGFLLDASLIWLATPLTTATFTAKSSVDESTLPGVSGALNQDFGVRIDHSFRRWLVGTAQFGYGTTSYDGIDREDHHYLVSAALTWKLTRTVHLKGEYRREWLKSDGGSDYNADVFLVGLRLQR